MITNDNQAWQDTSAPSPLIEVRCDDRSIFTSMFKKSELLDPWRKLIKTGYTPTIHPYGIYGDR